MWTIAVYLQVMWQFTTRMANSGTSSKKSDQYFVPMAHPGTFKITQMTKMVSTKVGLSGFMKKNEVWLMIAMLFCVEIIFFVCVAQKCGWNLNSSLMNLRTSINCFPPVFCQQKHLCSKVIVFRAGTQVLAEQTLCITYQVKKDNKENYLNKWRRKLDWRSFQGL